MSVIRIDVLNECDGCSKRFGVEVDLAAEVEALDSDSSAQSVIDVLVREMIHNGEAGYTWGVRGKQTVDRLPLSYQATVQGGMVLCDVCSRKCDDLPIEGALTKAQVIKAVREEGDES